jgi:predicted nucleotidyltransferase
MDRNLATEEIKEFLTRLSQKYISPIKVYLLGGSALCFLGNQRRTIDIDIFVDLLHAEFEDIVKEVAQELHLEVELIAIESFIPLPSDTISRHRKLGNFGSIEVSIFDPYSIALSKVARGFETDIQDVLFLLQNQIIEIEKLTKFVEDTIPLAWDYDIDPGELRNHLEVVKKLYP